MERCKVLIADDNMRARLGLRALLSLEPEIEIVDEAADGQEAVRMARDDQPDVVVMDVRMPQMNGLEATREIKAHRPQVRIVVVSMHACHEAEALAAGADAFMVKGCPPGDLLAAVLEGQEENEMATVQPGMETRG